MFQPDDLIQDELEHPELTQQLQQRYIPALADQRSLLHIRTRLLARRAAEMAAGSNTEVLPTVSAPSSSHEATGRPVVGQFFSPPAPVPPPPSRRPRRPLRPWRVVALVAALCIVILSGTWYALTHAHTQAGTPNRPSVTPTTVPDQLSASSSLSDLKMTSTSVGWAREETFTADQETFTADQETFSVARTTNGGKTWRVFDFQGQAAGLMGHVFLDDQTAWIFIGSSESPQESTTVMHTTDGGAHWTTQHLPSGMNSITFVDQEHGWAWASEAQGNNPAMLILYKTSDGGATWSSSGTLSTTQSPGNPAPGPLPLGGHLNLSFQTPQRGWAIVGLLQSVQDFLYKTSDGGATWQYQPLPQPATGPIPGIQVAIQASSQSGAFVSMLLNPFTPGSQSGSLIVTSQAGAQTPREMYMYKMTDGGLHWSLQGTNIEDMSRAQGIGAVPDLTHLLLVNQSTIMLYALVNGRWQKQATSQMVGVKNLGFLSNQDGWAYASQQMGSQLVEALSVTSNGGASWYKVVQRQVTLLENTPAG